jgi:hypothetical protein
MSSLRVAARGIKPLVLRLDRHTGAVLRQLRHGVEHVLNERAMPWVQSSMAVDVVSEVQRMVAARRVV